MQLCRKRSTLKVCHLYYNLIFASENEGVSLRVARCGWAFSLLAMILLRRLRPSCSLAIWQRE